MNKDPRLFLEHILDSIARVERVLSRLSKKEFLVSEDAQDIITRRVEVIGEAVRNLPKDLRERNPHVPWKNIVGTRDFLVHEYFDVDMVLLWQITKKDLPKLKKNVLQILDRLDK